ncbi:unnamed protein product [Mucor circinelloides]
MGKSVRWRCSSQQHLPQLVPFFLISNQFTSPVIVHTNTLAAHADYKPEVKILKRPQDAQSKKEITLTKPVKTLAEKEKDYEAAKRLIDEKFEKKK